MMHPVDEPGTFVKDPISLYTRAKDLEKLLMEYDGETCHHEHMSHCVSAMATFDVRCLIEPYAGVKDRCRTISDETSVDFATNKTNYDAAVTVWDNPQPPLFPGGTRPPG